MLNRFLSLLLGAVAPLFGLLVLATSGLRQGADAATFAERAPCLALAAMCLALSLCHAAAAKGAFRLRAQMWFGLGVYFLALAVAAPHVSMLLVLAALSLALTSIAVLVRDAGRGARAVGPQRDRRQFSGAIR